MTSATQDRPLNFHALSVLDEGDEVVVGRPDTNMYVVLGPDGAALLDELRSGRTPDEAAAWYRARFGEPVDMADFVGSLHELGFVAEAGSVPDQERSVHERVRWQRLGRALFSPVGWLAMAVIIAGAVALWVRHPQFAPDPRQLFFTDSLVVVQFTLIFGQLPFTLLHETFHVLAGRRLGLPTRLRLSHRLYFVVFETELDGLVSVPRRSRYLPMLAGLLADTVIVAGLTILAYVTGTGSGPSTIGTICLALSFGTLLRITWQFYFFLRTDIYYLIVTVTRCIDLQGTSLMMLRNWGNWLLGRRHLIIDPGAWHPRDRRVARWYTPVLVLGSVASVAVLVFTLVPLMIDLMTSAVQRLFGGQSGGAGHVVDSAVLVGLTLGQLVLAALLATRNRRARRSPTTGRHRRAGAGTHPHSHRRPGKTRRTQ